MNKAGKVLKAINENIKKSSKLQYGYEIYNKKTKNSGKVGTSGGKLNKNGSSRKAPSQVNRWNKTMGYNKYAARVVKKNVSGRSRILNWERGGATATIRASGNMSIHKRPR